MAQDIRCTIHDSDIPCAKCLASNTTDSKQDEALLPCPFCGSHAHIRQTRIPEGSRLIAYWIECVICEVGTKYNDNQGGAITTWNTRSRASLAAPEGDVIDREAAIKAITEHHARNHYGATYRHAVGNIIRILKAQPAAASSLLPAEPSKFVSEVDQWKHDLTTAGWIAETALNWRAPDGSLWRGPAGAWKELQRRKAAAPAEPRQEGEQEKGNE